MENENAALAEKRSELEADQRLKECEEEKHDFVTSLKMSAQEHARTRDEAAKLTDEIEAIAWDLSAGMNWREVRDRLLTAVTASGLAR